MFTDYYKQKYTEYKKESVENILAGKEDNNIRKKAINEFKRNKEIFNMHNINLQQHIDNVFYNIKAKKDLTYMIHYSKRPDRQNLAEKAQLNYLNSKLNNCVIKLPVSGKNSLTCNKYGEIGNYPKSDCKTLDFQYSRVNMYYFTAKYTEELGGSQDNQFNDVINTLSNFEKNLDEYTYMIALLDGDYYQMKNPKSKKYNNMSRMEYLKDRFKYCQRILIGTSDEIINIIHNIEDSYD